MNVHMRGRTRKGEGEAASPFDIVAGAHVRSTEVAQVVEAPFVSDPVPRILDGWVGIVE
jgi:hypothetical protein